jgi:F0F1-type ATP synthase assembly protein I
MVVGLLVDHLAGTEPVFTLVGIALGIAFGVAAFVVRVRSVFK